MEAEDKLITVRTCNNLFEAEVLCSRLLSEGINATIRDCSDVAYHLSPYGPTGCFEVIVHATDAAKAEQALQ